MSKIDTVLEEYDAGVITRDELMLRILSTTNKDAVARTLRKLPAEIGAELEEFAARYRATMRLFRGSPRPLIPTVRYVNRWYQCKKRAIPARRKGGAARLAIPPWKREA